MKHKTAPKNPVCLIVPPSIFLLDERVFMSLGILKIAAVLEEAGVTVEVLDLSGISNYEEAVCDHAALSKASVFGITGTTPQMPAVAKIAKTLRHVRPDARLILGGPHISLVHAAFKKERKLGLQGRATKTIQQMQEMFDILVTGDGEEAIFAALESEAPQLVDGDDPASALFLTNERLAELPFPARHLVDVGTYHYQIDGVEALSLIAQLGCPFECGFCGGRASPFLRRVRMRPTAHVVAELAHLYETYGIRGFMLYDDELNVNPRMIELMQAIADTQRKLGTEFRLRGFIKAQLFTDAQAEAMFRSGFRWILTGFESGSPRILKNINKKSTLEENTRCLQIARRHGLKVKALMSIGHPGETEQTVLQTRDWLLEVRPDDFDVTIITTYPGTPYYDDALAHATLPGVWTYTAPKNGDRLHSYEVDYTEVAEYYKGIPDGGYKAYVFTDALKSEDLVSLRDQIERQVREQLNLPFNPAGSSIRYEHAMGQFGKQLPPTILRTTRVHGRPEGKRAPHLVASSAA